MYSSPASPSSLTRSQAFSSAYRQVGIETSVACASPHQLVQLLFDGVLEAIVQARGSMREGQIGAKGRAIGRAVRIIDEGLKASLDLRSRGTLAQDLDDLYAYVTLRLTQANLRNDEAALGECMALIQPLREAWSSIGPAAQAHHV
jgi:flagellar secretion chaperone FliS